MKTIILKPSELIDRALYLLQQVPDKEKKQIKLAIRKLINKQIEFEIKGN